jgi:hypothetical protein
MLELSARLCSTLCRISFTSWDLEVSGVSRNKLSYLLTNDLYLCQAQKQPGLHIVSFNLSTISKVNISSPIFKWRNRGSEKCRSFLKIILLENHETGMQTLSEYQSLLFPLCDTIHGSYWAFNHRTNASQQHERKYKWEKKTGIFSPKIWLHYTKYTESLPSLGWFKVL